MCVALRVNHVLLIRSDWMWFDA